MYVQFEHAVDPQSTDPLAPKVVSVFAGPQDPEVWPNQAEVPDDDLRYLAFLAYMNPPPDVLALQSAKLQGLIRLAAAQKLSLTERISTINDAIELEMATPEEEVELPVRQAQLLEWKRYAVYLGRVTSQAGWPPEVTWPVQPAEGMDLTVSAVTPETA